ncbi:TfoX/Sxy family protein [Nocardia takedensis]
MPSGSAAANARTDLVERLRAALADQPTLREVSMFGGRAFMVNDKMVACVRKQGDLLVRVAADRHEELLRERGATWAEMKPDRRMAAGWLSITATTLTDDDALSFWLTAALTHNRTVTE